MILPVLALISLLQVYFCEAAIYAARFDSNFYYQEFADQSASFGPDISDEHICGLLINAIPQSACNDSLDPPPNEFNRFGKWILLVPRYTLEENCTFEMKVRMAELKGYDAVIVYNIGSNALVPMSAKNATGINIPSVFVGQSAGFTLKNMYTDLHSFYVVITSDTPFNIQTHLLIPFAIVVGICFIVMVVFMIVKYIKDRRRQRRYRLPKSHLNKIPTCKFQKGDKYETCAVCLEDYVEGEKLRVLPCNHVYHMKCIDPWLTKNKRVCPICKRKVFAHNEPHQDSDSDSDTDDTTPLIRSGSRGTQGGTFEVQNENPFSRAARSISQVLEGRNFVTASDHHSINAERLDRRSVDSTQSSDSTSSASSNSNTATSVDFVVHSTDRHDDFDSGHHDNSSEYHNASSSIQDNSHSFGSSDVIV